MEPDMTVYSMHVEEGASRQYMTIIEEANAQDAMRRFVSRIDPGAQMAKIEILEVLDEETA
jgi:hypothetical protein